MSTTGRTSHRRTPGPLWWANPYIFLACVLLPAAIIIASFSTSIVARNGHGYAAPNYISGGYLFLYLFPIVVLTAASWFGAQRPLPQKVYVFKPQALDFLFWSTAIAYAIWFGPVLAQQPSMVLGALVGQPGASYEIREANLNVRGVTTMTQFGIAYVSVFAITKYLLGHPLARRYSYYMAGVFLFALFRAIVNSERIALLELIFPFVLVYGSSAHARQHRLISAVCKVFPVLTILGAPVFFAIFEYNRSWVSHYQYRFSNIFAFSLERLLIYYVTALNNIAGFMQTLAWPTYGGELTLDWLFRAPFVSSLFPGAAELNREVYMRYLSEYASEEFNNATGTLIVFHDWGIVGGTLLFILLGLLTGLAFASFARKRGALMYAYPLLFYSLYESLRIGYVYDGRCVAAFIGMVFCALVWGRWGRPRSAPPRPASPARSASG